MDDQLYLERMEQSLDEKLWFTRHLDLSQYDLIIDFGCANGALLDKLAVDKNVKLVGYDKNPEFIKNNYCTTSFDHVIEELKKAKKSLIIFSSVMHEMDFLEIDSVLTQLVLYGINTIVIRDMHFVQNRYNVFPHVNLCKNNPYYKSFRHQEEITEFLLKYRYVENYARESQESYFSTPFDYIDNLLKNAYNKTFQFDYTNDFTRQCVKNDFNIDLCHFTHRCVIFSSRSSAWGL